MTFSRRDFVKTSMLGAVAAGVGAPAAIPEAAAANGQQSRAPQSDSAKRPIIICANNGYNYVDAAYAFLKGGGDTLEAGIRVVKGPEDDPNDDSVGLGGLPNEEGVVELDCLLHAWAHAARGFGRRRAQYQECVAGCEGSDGAHWPRHAGGRRRGTICCGDGISARESADRALAQNLAAVEGIQFRSRLVGAGDCRSALAARPRRNPSRRPKFGESAFSNCSSALPNLGIEPEFQLAAVRRVLFPPTGTIHCSALNEKGEISGITTTSGLAFKLPGRCGDSPIIGAGCYTDQDVGSAGATGSGEENIKVAGAHTIVENMRHGMSPQEAGWMRSNASCAITTAT